MVAPYLPLRESPQAGESLTSFTRRHNVAMGYENLHRLLTLLEESKFPRHMELLGRGPLLSALASLLRRDPEELVGMTVHAWADALVLRAQNAPVPASCDAQTVLRFFDAAHRRICPLCVEVSPVWERLVWTFRPLVICPDHAVFLIDRCPQCRRTFLPRRLDIAVCRCGASFAGIPAVTASVAVIEATHFMLKRLRRPPLSSLDLPSAAWFAWLDRLQSAILKTPTWLRRTRLEMELLESVGDEATAWLAAAEMILAGSSRQAEFLDEFQTLDRRCTPSTRIGRTFGQLLRDAERLERLGYAAPADGLRRYLLERYTRGHLNSKGILFRGPEHRRQLEDRPWITQTDAARFLHLRQPTIAELVRRGILQGSIQVSGPRGRTNGVVSRSSVAAYVRRLETAVSVRETAVRLGIDTPRVLELIRENVLTDAVRGPLGWLIPLDCVTGILDCVKQLPDLPVDRGRWIPFREALRRFGIGEFSVVRIVQLVRDEQLSARRDPAAPTLRGLYLDGTELRLRSRQAQAERRTASGYSLSHVAAALFPDRPIRVAVLRKWMDAGILRAERCRKAWRITPEEVTRFRATYCLAQEVCTLLNVARSTLDRWIIERRIVPVYSRRTHPGAGTPIFFRADVQRLAALRAA